MIDDTVGANDLQRAQPAFAAPAIVSALPASSSMLAPEHISGQTVLMVRSKISSIYRTK